MADPPLTAASGEPAGVAHAAPDLPDVVRCCGSSMMEAIRGNDLDLAERELAQLERLLEGRSQDAAIRHFRVLIAIQRGRSREALQSLDALAEDDVAPLRALCLYSIQDPLWQGLAEQLATEAPDPAVREAMGAMLAAYRSIPAEGRRA